MTRLKFVGLQFNKSVFGPGQCLRQAALLSEYLFIPPLVKLSCWHNLANSQHYLQWTSIPLRGNSSVEDDARKPQTKFNF